VIGDLESHAFFDDTVFTETSTVQTGCVGAMRDTNDAVTRLVVLCDFGSKGDDCASEVAPDSGAFGREEFVVDMLPGEL
jgi:hypothetical protein